MREPKGAVRFRIKDGAHPGAGLYFDHRLRFGGASPGTHQKIVALEHGGHLPQGQRCIPFRGNYENPQAARAAKSGNSDLTAHAGELDLDSNNLRVSPSKVSSHVYHRMWDRQSGGRSPVLRVAGLS